MSSAVARSRQGANGSAGPAQPRPHPQLPTRGAAGQVVAALRRAGPSTRAELGEGLSLSRASVSAALASLTRAGLVAEHPATTTESRVPRGRPPTLVSLTRQAGIAIGVDLGRRHLRVAVADLGHTILAERAERFDVDFHPTEALDEVCHLVTAVLQDAGAEASEAVGVGLGLPAPLDADGRPVNLSIPPGWLGHQPAEELRARLNLPVSADNDANLGALAESQWGAGRGCGAILYIKAATGIGGGLVIDGQVFRGAGGTAGEIGHTTVDDSGAVCACGNRGCLELRAGGAALVAQLAQTDVHVNGLPALVAKAREGHLGCRRVLADAGEAIGFAVAAVVNVLNPELVVLGGELGEAGELVLESLRGRVRRNALAPAAGETKIVAAALGERAEVLGAALLVLREPARFAAA